MKEYEYIILYITKHKPSQAYSTNMTVSSVHLSGLQTHQILIQQCHLRMSGSGDLQH